MRVDAILSNSYNGNKNVYELHDFIYIIYEMNILLYEWSSVSKSELINSFSLWNYGKIKGKKPTLKLHTI